MDTIRNVRNGKMIVCMTRRTLVQYLAWELGTSGANRMLQGKAGSGRYQPSQVAVETFNGHSFVGWTVNVVSLPLSGKISAYEWRRAKARVEQAAAYIDGKLRKPMQWHDVRIVDFKEVAPA